MANASKKYKMLYVVNSTLLPQSPEVKLLTLCADADTVCAPTAESPSHPLKLVSWA